MDFVQLAKKFDRMLDDMPDDYMGEFVKYEDELTKANTEQLRQGKKADNTRITPNYTVDYAEIKKREGSISSPTPDLHRTGGFYRSLFIVQTNKPGEVFLGSDYVVNGFPLGQALIGKYGEEILGYFDPTLEKYAKKTLVDYKKQLENGLKK